MEHLMDEKILAAEERDEEENNILTAGGVFMALYLADVKPELIMRNGYATNMIKIKPPHMKSRYLVTITRITDEEDQD